MSFPDYYTILCIEETATSDEIRTAYKKQSLIHHPDRVPAGPGAEVKRKAATIQFQGISDAFYTLSDPQRRSAYDRTRAQQDKSRRTGDANSSSSYFDFFSNLASGSAAGSGNKGTAGTRPNAEFVFSDVFADMLEPELGRRGLPIWRVIGAVGGAALGFIVGNFPGAAIGVYAGSKIGEVRDSKGKAVYEVFKDLGADQKAEILRGLVAKVFGMTGIGGSSR